MRLGGKLRVPKCRGQRCIHCINFTKVWGGEKTTKGGEKTTKGGEKTTKGGERLLRGREDY